MDEPLSLEDLAARAEAGGNIWAEAVASGQALKVLRDAGYTICVQE